MDVLVTGSSGLIGTALTARLRAEGHRVVTLRRGSATGPDAARWDPAAGTIDAAAIDGLDAVVHLAGEGVAERRWTPEQKRRIRDSRLDGTRLLAETLARLDRPPSVLVSGSAIGYYGDRGDEVLTEASAPGGDFLAEVCVDWEAATEPAAAAGIRTVVVRTGVVLDPAGGLLGRILLPFRLGLGGRLGSGRQWMSWISQRDEVGAIVHLLGDPGATGPVNLTAPEPVTNQAFTDVLGRVLRRPTVLPVPTFAIKARYGAELVETAFLASQRVLPATLEARGYRFEQPELEPALRAMLDRPAA